MEKGKFVVVDGLDGVGKGVFLDTFMEEAIRDGKRVYDVNKFWQGRNKHPQLSRLFSYLGLKVPAWEIKPDFHPDPEKIIGKYDVIITSEPTFVGVGRYIREELIAKNNRNYSPEVVAQAYALDRMILYQQLLIPILNAGIDVYQSRSFSTSIVYQRQMALDEGREFSIDEILKIPGNAFCYRKENLMDHLVIPTIKDVNEAVRRAKSREKQDDCRFENLQFQLKLKRHYDSPEFRKVFESQGVKVTEMNAGISIESSKEQAIEFYWEELK